MSGILFWVILIISGAIILGAMILIGTFYKEDQIWRVLLSLMVGAVVLIIFGGAYFAGKNGWWWMSILFVAVALITVYLLLEPD